eukprot:2725188-Ditylum_brightwellii.AAC.1
MHVSYYSVSVIAQGIPVNVNLNEEVQQTREEVVKGSNCDRVLRFGVGNNDEYAPENRPNTEDPALITLT